MPLPAGVETVTLSSGVPMTLPDGTWIKGKLWFTFVDLATVAEDDLTFGGAVEVDLVDGEFSVRLVANDATGINPTGGVYEVRSEFTNAPDWDPRYVQLLKASPSVKFADVVIPDPIAGTYAVLVDPSSIEGATPASTVVAETAFGQTSAVGAATTFARGDHTHGTPAAPTVPSASSTVTAQTSFGAASGAGVATAFARGDHAHGTPPAPTAGTTAGTFAAGNDARLSDARTPSGAASGDLSGTYPGPAVAKVNGIAVTGTPSTGQVLTATGSAAATWQTPSGGGGSSIVSADTQINEEIVVLTNAATWTTVTTSLGVEIGGKVQSAVGHRVLWSPTFMRTGGVVFLDLAVKKVGGGFRYASSGTTTPRVEGYAALYPLAPFVGVLGLRQFTVQADEIDGDGNFTIVLRYIGAADGVNQKIYAGSGYDAFMLMLDIDA